MSLPHTNTVHTGELNYPEPLQSVGWRQNLNTIGLPAHQLSLLSLAWFVIVLLQAYQEPFSLHHWTTNVIAVVSFGLAIVIEWRTVANPCRRFPRYWAVILLVLSFVNVGLILVIYANPIFVKNTLQNFFLTWYPLCPMTWATGAALIALAPRMIPATPTDWWLHWITPLTVVLASAFIVTVWVNRHDPELAASETDLISANCIFKKTDINTATDTNTDTNLPAKAQTVTTTETNPPETAIATEVNSSAETQTVTVSETNLPAGTQTVTAPVIDDSSLSRQRFRANSVNEIVNVGEKLEITVEKYFLFSKPSELKLETKPILGTAKLDKETNPTLLIYTASKKHGNDIISYDAIDEFGNEISWVIHILVNGAPELKPDMSPIKVKKNKVSLRLSITDYFIDAEKDTFQVNQCSPDAGSLEYSDKDRAFFRYRPDKGFSGTVHISCTVKDAHGANQTVKLPVEVLNTPPVIRGKERKYRVTAGSKLKINIDAYDPDGDELSLKIIDGVNEITQSGLELIYQPALNTKKKQEVIRYEVSDGESLSSSKVIVAIEKPEPPPRQFPEPKVKTPTAKDKTADKPQRKTPKDSCANADIIGGGAWCDD